MVGSDVFDAEGREDQGRTDFCTGSVDDDTRHDEHHSSSEQRVGDDRRLTSSTRPPDGDGIARRASRGLPAQAPQPVVGRDYQAWMTMLQMAHMELSCLEKIMELRAFPEMPPFHQSMMASVTNDNATPNSTDDLLHDFWDPMLLQDIFGARIDSNDPLMTNGQAWWGDLVGERP
ncbi:hypothetical protein KVT40_008639 [Elsinoe batatas]|uniref:Uncharacterized protein n=1 Tax=Elsinoe batatas TaxID=2601811 RepID=A0A8K0L0Q1_9PEZI|nr:hypothetical protein KVT40_008639 [Elsinoe batatas]